MANSKQTKKQVIDRSPAINRVAKTRPTPSNDDAPVEKPAKPASAEKKITAKRGSAVYASKPSRKVNKRPKSALNPFFGKKAVKPEQTIKLDNGNKIEVFGIRAAGKRYVLIKEGRREALIPYAAWHGSGSDASTALVRQGITVVGSMQAVKAAVAQLKHFRRARVAVGPGWTTEGFALASGTVLVGADQRRHFKSFTPVPEIMDRQGSLKEWKARVAGPLADHKLASFFIMATFASPLLRLTDRTDNFGLELAGLAGRGKSTLQLLMASAAGPAIGSDGATYWRSCNSTMNALEATMSLFNDMPLILDEAGLVQGSGRTEDRGREMRAMAFRLSQGRVKHRLGEEVGPVYRFVYVLSTNRPVASLLTSAHAVEAEAIADRLITVPLTPDRKFGIFDRSSKGYASTGAFADALKRAAAEHYGHGLPAFLQYLVQRKVDGEKELRLWIKGRVTKFIEACGADASDGSQRRMAEAFGLVYAAGLLAKRAGVLPDSYRCNQAALACYELHRSHGRVARAFDDRLTGLMRHPDTIDLDKVDVSKMSEKELAACRAFLYTSRSGERELLLRQSQRQRAFPDWNKIRHGSEVERRLKTSKDRNVVPRPIVPGAKSEDVYCFDITDLED